MKRLLKFLKGKEGATATEYAVMVALIVIVALAAITISLIRPLMKLASACNENSRFKPASGEILDSLGESASYDHTS